MHACSLLGGVGAPPPAATAAPACCHPAAAPAFEAKRPSLPPCRTGRVLEDTFFKQAKVVEEATEKRPQNDQPSIGDGDFFGGAKVHIKRGGGGLGEFLVQQVEQLTLFFGAQSVFGCGLT